MKRLFVSSLALLTCLLLTACTTNTPAKSSAVISSSGTAVVSGAAADRTVRVGLGCVATTSESTGATSGAPGLAATSVSVCALAIDKDDKIVNIRFDTVQSEIGFDALGMLTGDIGNEIQTKKELGTNYGMKGVSGIGKEWYEQIAALENWMIGKKVSDVLGMKTFQKDDQHPNVPQEEDLKTSVTISVTDQLRALEKAYSDAQK
jgi:hypothetical protein